MIFKKSLKYGMAGELVSFNTRQLSDIYRQRNCFALIIS